MNIMLNVNVVQKYAPNNKAQFDQYLGDTPVA